MIEKKINQYAKIREYMDNEGFDKMCTKHEGFIVFWFSKQFKECCNCENEREVKQLRKEKDIGQYFKLKIIPTGSRKLRRKRVRRA
jgi:hypothetical protein